jgi:aldehyde dehydrogenase (NAD+)
MLTNQPDVLTETADYEAVFARQRAHAPVMALTTADDRLARIRRLRDWISTHEADIRQAMYADFRKPPAEVVLTELFGLTGEINHALKNLRRWMRPQRVPTPLSMMGTSGKIVHEPKGNVLIISPWNYPFVLTVKPLISAIAAGNVVILKPSELTPHVSALLKRMVTDLFPVEEVALFEGDATVAQGLLALPFNHIFFTGSPAIGKVVMAAAAKHLTSVTLELGGKSPAIIDETADLKATAELLAWGKGINNGQTCIAPDYVLVQETVKDKFVEAFRVATNAMYNPDGQGVEQSVSYARIVNRRHFERVKSLLDEAVSGGATVTVGGKHNAGTNFMEPTVVEQVTDGMRIMQEEIFGPLLPVLTWRDRAEVLQTVNSREKPLALYIHSRNRANIDYWLARTSAGDTLINEVMFQFTNVELPFGGVNNSGLGKSNGYFSFQGFSNQRGVMERTLGTMTMMYPPYTGQKTKLIDFIRKYIA